MEKYLASENRYTDSDKVYRRCGKSGILLPKLSLGLWQNFGESNDAENCRAVLRYAFDRGITHFDFANNYGPPPGAAEELFGRFLKEDFAPYRDEMFIATKAGYEMWAGPYGNSRCPDRDGDQPAPSPQSGG